MKHSNTSYIYIVSLSLTREATSDIRGIVSPAGSYKSWDIHVYIYIYTDILSNQLFDIGM